MHNMYSIKVKLYNYRVDVIVVFAQFAIFVTNIPSTGDLTPQGEEENTQTDQTQEHCPARGREQGE